MSQSQSVAAGDSMHTYKYVYIYIISYIQLPRRIHTEKSWEMFEDRLRLGIASFLSTQVTKY